MDYKWATLIDRMGSDLTVVNAARVSFATKHEEFKEKQDEKLIRYLAKHGHWSPFAHCSLQYHIRAPIFVARQLVKHQVGLSWNEVSRRYVDIEPEFYSVDKWRTLPVETGDFYIFPGWLEHKTETNKSDEERIIMSLNITRK